LGGGDCLKFSDVVIATAALVLFGLILDAILMVAFVPLKPNSTSDSLSYIISYLVVSLVVGYVFALKIQEESRIRAVLGITVLSSFLVMFFFAIWMANPLASPWFKDSLSTLYNTSGWTDYQWSAYTSLSVSLDVVVGFVLGFIGLYAGSMLRKAKKS
jgi:general stress protein CsbA